MNFLEAAGTNAGGGMWLASVVRSQTPDADLETFVHDGAPGHIQAWWGPFLEIESGSRIKYFRTVAGICIESVKSPAAAGPTFPALPTSDNPT